MAPLPYPATPPPLPHSISSPNLSLTSPNPQSAAAPSKNYHPYLIQTTSSSLLTRFNSSPSQPLTDLSNHRPSRSMSSLSQAASPGPLQEHDGRMNVESPSVRPRMRRSGTLPTLSSVAEKKEKGEEVPINPKLWTPSELARYLGQNLRTGGSDGSGQTLPAPLVKDIESWVLRQQVTGRVFLKGNADGWASASRPPPFLPLLLSISRRLRRSSLQSRIARSSDSSRSLPGAGLPNESSLGTGSLLEEEELLSDEEDEVTGVRRMANAFDARGSTSEASGDDEPSPEKVKAQWTGGSASSEGWKRWELQRSTTGSSQQGGYARKRRESNLSLNGMADAESSPVVRSQEMRDSSPESDIVTPMNDVPEEVEIANAAVIADVQMQTDPTEIIEPSPPPPYTSPSGDTPITPADLPTPPLHILRSDRSSITPTPDRPRLLSGLGLSPVTPVDTPSKDASRSPHMVKMLQHTTTGINPYAALRRTSSCNSANGGSRIESVLSSQFPEDETPPPGAAVESERSRYSTSRRVTLRPNTVNGLFRKEASLPEQTEREREMETQVASLLGRIVDLESRLDRASRPPSPVSPMLAIFRESVLDRLGLGPIDPEDPLPKRIKELPVYLFFVGMGVGAVMVRVLFGRAR